MYRRKSYSYRGRKRTVRSAKRSGPRRRFPTKKRTYRKKGAMTKKRILNTTSRKKRDTMLAYSNITTSNPNGSTTFTNDGAVLNGNQTYTMLWCATSRDLSNSGGGANIVINRSERTANTCYMRGLSEICRIQTVDGLPWTWRRICFTVKGTAIKGASTTVRALTAETAPGGVRRVLAPWQTDVTVPNLVFRGAASVDWNDALTAPLDTTRITVRYDRTVTIASGNEEGSNRVYKRWHPMNKNLVYDDDENGDGETSSGYSTTGKAGMGDYYVYDIFVPRYGGAASSQLMFTPESSLYWHEK